MTEKELRMLKENVKLALQLGVAELDTLVVRLARAYREAHEEEERETEQLHDSRCEN